MKTLTELRREHYLPKPFKEWRSVQQPIKGQINALDRFNGFAIATNGIIVAIETACGDVLFGHLQWFVPDVEDELEQLVSPAKRKTNHKLDCLKEFV